MRRSLVTAGALLGVFLLGGGATAAEREYSVSAGLGSLLAPTGPLLGSFALSASVSPSGGGLRLVRARGELDIMVGDGAWAALPTICGDTGIRLGRLDLYVTGGLELFGGANRTDYTIFSTLGFLGGGGVAWRLSQRTRLGLRALVTWLPSFTAANLSAPEGAAKPNYLFLAGLLSLEIVGGEVYEGFDFDENPETF